MLPERDRWLLVEDLDPDISHFEFFVSRTPIRPQAWDDDCELLKTRGRRQPCLWGWPSANLLGPDLEPISLSAAEFALLEAIENQPSRSLGELGLSDETASVARELMARKLLLLEV